MTKRKLYWVMLFPSIVLFAIILILLPADKKNYAVFLTLLFWIVYYSILKGIDLKAKKMK